MITTKDPISALQSTDDRLRRLAVKAARFSTQQLAGAQLQQFTKDLSTFLRKYVPDQSAQEKPNDQHSLLDQNEGSSSARQ